MKTALIYMYIKYVYDYSNNLVSNISNFPSIYSWKDQLLG